MDNSPNLILSLEAYRHHIVSRIQEPSLLEKIDLKRRGVKVSIVEDDNERIWFPIYRKAFSGAQINCFVTTEAALNAINEIKDEKDLPTHFISDGMDDIDAPFRLIGALKKKIKSFGRDPAHTTVVYVVSVSEDTLNRAKNEHILCIDKEKIIDGRVQPKDIILPK